LLLVFFSLYLSLTHSGFIQEKIKNQIGQMVRDNSSYEIHISSFKILSPLTYKIEGISLQKKGIPVLDIAECTCKLSFRSFIEKKVIIDDLKLSYVILHEIAQETSSHAMPSFSLNALTIENLAYKSYRCPFKIEGSLCAQDTLYCKLILSSPEEQNYDLLAEIGKDKGIVQCLRSDQSALKCTYTYDGTNYLALLKGCCTWGTFNGYLKCGNDFELTPSLFTCEIYKTEKNDTIDIKGAICGKLFNPEIKIEGKCPILHFLDKKFTDLSLKGCFNQALKCDLFFTKDQNRYHLPFEKKGDSFLNVDVKLSHILEWLELDTLAAEGSLHMYLDNHLSLRAQVLSGKLQCLHLDTEYAIDLLVAQIDSKKIYLEALKLRDEKKGALRASGTLDFSKGFLFNIHLKKFPLFHWESLDAVSSGSLKLSGDLSSCSLKGLLKLDLLEIHIPQEFNVETFERLELRFKDEEIFISEKNSSPYPMALDLKVTLANDLKIAGRGLNSTWSGNVNILGDLNTPLYYGTVELLEGSYPFLGRTIQLKEGLIDLNGTLEEESKLYLVASLDSEQHQIEAILKGKVFDPKLTFRATPPLSKKEILSRVLFNKSVSDVTSKQALFLQNSMKLEDSSTISNGPEGDHALSKIQKTLGIDRIDLKQIEGQENSSYSIQLGKYLSDSTYLKLTSNFLNRLRQTTGAHSIGIDSSLGHNVHIQAEVDDNSNGQLNILWKKDY
jgi:hypothetical protein